MIGVDYHGLPAFRLESRWIRVDVLAKGGPRIIRLLRAGSEDNLLAETPEINWPTPHGTYSLYGGHRLWVAPEVGGTTDFPDDHGLEFIPLADGARLSSHRADPNGIHKMIELHLEKDKPALKLVHTLHNRGAAAVELAAWAITQLPLGGQIILPQPDRPGRNPLLPNRRLSIWPYTRLSDPRLVLGDEIITLSAQPDPQAIKVGYWNTHGWAAYVKKEVKLVKHFTVIPGNYPDWGCNVEAYCRNRFCELETLGPLVTLLPGKTTTHIEEWEIIDETAGSF